MWITWKVFVRDTCFCKIILADFTLSWVFEKSFNFVPMLESRNMDHVKRNCSWDMLLWKKSSGLQTFMSFSKIFLFCTNARITKCGSRERQLYVRHVFLKKLQADFPVSWVFQNHLNFALMLEWRNVDRVKSNCSWTCFCKKIQADFTVSWVSQKYLNFVPMLERRNVDHVRGNCWWNVFLWKNFGEIHSFMCFS